KTGTSGCSSLQESESYGRAGICLAGPSYDGPSGVGTPDGIGAFQPPPAPGGQGPSTTPGGPAGGGVTGTAQAGGEGQLGAPASGAPVGAGAAGASSSPPARRAARVPVVSGLRLTARAVVALRGAHAHVFQVGFAFSLSAGANLRVTLARQVRAGARPSWK